MKSGDAVTRKNDTETLLVAGVSGSAFTWYGWPPGCDKIEDYDITESCSKERNLESLKDVCKNYHDDSIRVRFAKHEFEENYPVEYARHFKDDIEKEIDREQDKIQGSLNKIAYYKKKLLLLEE